MSDVVLLGPPGSGKGTQAARLTSANGWVHLSTGDLFRDHLKRRTALGELARTYMDEGQLVPDGLTVDMVRARLREVPPPTRVVFDGFPRTVAQAAALSELLPELGRELGRVLALEVPRDEIIRRIAGRVTCGNCHAVFNLEASPPRRPGFCDRCGAAVATRSDETPEVVATRLEVYERQTAPLVAFYRARGLLEGIDGRGSLEEVRSRIEAALR